MSSLKVRHRLRLIKAMDLNDLINLVGTVLARIRTQTFYKFMFRKIGSRTWIKPLEQLWGASRISIGSRVRIERGAILYVVRRYAGKDYHGFIEIGDDTFANCSFNATAAFGISIGKGVVFAPNVFLNDFDHGYAQLNVNRLESDLESKGQIRIGDGCWLGANCFVSSGVELGEQCVVGANSVVTSSFPAFTMLAGAPARAIKTYDPSTATWKLANRVHD